MTNINFKTSEINIGVIEIGEVRTISHNIDGIDVGNPCIISITPFPEGEAIIVSIPQCDSFGNIVFVLENLGEYDVDFGHNSTINVIYFN